MHNARKHVDLIILCVLYTSSTLSCTVESLRSLNVRGQLFGIAISLWLEFLHADISQVLLYQQAVGFCGFGYPCALVSDSSGKKRYQIVSHNRTEAQTLT